VSERWEYRLIQWTSSTEFRNGGQNPDGTTKSTQLWKSVFQIKEAGKETEERLQYSNHADDESAETISITDLLAEFGIEGWELVSETVLDSVVIPKANGWSNVGIPIQIRWAMKRRAQPKADPA
jgi:hypothetical protein